MEDLRPDVSVCLCTYHVPEHPRIQWLNGCIQSILGQEGVSLELIVLDNGSTWEVGELLNAIQDPRMKRLRFEVNCQDHNWGTLSKGATGRYICFFCDDDEMLPGCLSSQVQVLDATCGALAVPFDIPHEDITFENLFIRCFIPFPGTLFQAKFKDIVREEMGDSVEGDWALWLAIAARGSMVRTTPGLVKLRIHKGSDSERRGFRACEFVEAHLQLWDRWINGRGYVPDEASIWGMIHHFGWFLQRSTCTEEKRLDYLRRLRKLIAGIG